MWIKTSDKMPPKGQWVLVTKNDFQKPLEIECFLGVRTNQYCSKETNWEWEDYEYNAWTSGHGDISSENPVAWMQLPEPYSS